MKLQIMFAAGMLAVAGCASNPAPSQTAARPAAVPLPDAEKPAGDPAAYIGDILLYELLKTTPLDVASLYALSVYEYKVGGIFMDRVGEVAEDSGASVSARVNALNLIAERYSLRQFEPVRTALQARDPRVRAAALNAANELRLVGSKDAVSLLRMALHDPAPEIQAKALQYAGDSDLGLLRTIAASPSTSREVVTAITGFVQAAEERGAPLASDSTGVIVRTSATGHRVRFVPSHRWPQWDAAAGRVSVRTAQGRSIELPGVIEVVASVMPVFFSSDGRHMVYESDRRIHVRDLATGEDRDIGEGIAPRIRPFTESFLFMREDVNARASSRGGTRLRYEVFSAPFDAAAADAAPKALGNAAAAAQQGTYGNYAPVRWMRVEDRDNTFFLIGESLEPFRLPSPFDGGAGR